ncbi:MAG: PRC-barrel domain-containing protein [Nitrososphaeraceae archaeon]
MNDYPYSNFIGSVVFTTDNKKIGKIIAIDKSKHRQYFTVLNKGIIHDEEFHIPLNSISKILDKESEIFLTLTEEEIKHGYEFLDTDHPSSDLVSGKSNSTLSVPFKKETIKYESFSYNLENSNDTNSKIKETEFLCDRCQSKFNDPTKLEIHRKNKH